MPEGFFNKIGSPNLLLPESKERKGPGLAFNRTSSRLQGSLLFHDQTLRVVIVMYGYLDRCDAEI